MIDIRRAAALLGGIVVGRDRIIAPGPGHSRADRSLSIRFDSKAPDGFVVYSFANDDWGACRDQIRERLGLGDQRNVFVFGMRTDAGRDDRDDAGRTARALSLWKAGQSPSGTPVETYLSRRGLTFPEGAAGKAIRWHAACPFGPHRCGAMLALVRHIETNEPIGLHRTAITADGMKRGDLGSGGRMMLGRAAGGVVKLTCDAEVTLALGIGEGIESTLSLQKLPEFGNTPVWAALSAGLLAGFPLLSGIESLWIAVDNEEAGRAAAQVTAERWRERDVRRVVPDQWGHDLNDIVAEAPSDDAA
ncbi:toprim domain-containing protein [Pseudoxanthobacter sp. M-2]|uniref:DUF7146 domain-containing protein n=1 Tax=Pseudoxanthobacter sp. M-2 TaxID=3078754 RepID=UPI0038FBFE68